jgi:post-segregation antitoxin (ccd killing protein)
MHEAVSMQGRKPEMALKIYKDGQEYAHSSISIPRHVRDEAKARKINISGFMTEALLQKFREDDNREPVYE